MLTLFHAPNSRSTRVIWLLEELGNPDVAIEVVDIHRAMTDSGSPDRHNPHPEGKVPLLVHNGVQVRETNAILCYLTELFPEKGLGVPPGDPKRGEFLAWMAWYGNVMEPVLIATAAGLEHEFLRVSLRGMPEVCARLETALSGRPFLLGDRFTVADLICQSPFAFFPERLPESQDVRDWVARCQARPANARAAERDAAWSMVPA